ncbi:hypothetical protein Z945_2915 [Sulfitobacter noctilucae]|nr:hypothetical protein Z945_2915 [Sulfitobacter noctilucae]
MLTQKFLYPCIPSLDEIRSAPSRIHWMIVPTLICVRDLAF